LAVAAITTLAAVLVTAASALAGASETATYEYDALGRLEKVTRDDGTDITVVDYDYDDAGNRTKRTVGDGGGGGGGGGNPPSNSPPSAVFDSVFTTQMYSNTYASVTANDSDPDGDPLTITAVTQPSNGFVVIQSATVLRIFSTASGTDLFTYTISDGNGGTDIAIVSFTVSSGGGPPPP